MGGEGDGGVVDENSSGEVAVEHAEILGVEAVAGLDAGVAEEAAGDVLALGVQVVDHHVGVAGVGGREHHQLEQPRQLLQRAHCERPHVDARPHRLPVPELDRQHHVARLIRRVVAVNQRLV